MVESGTKTFALASFSKTFSSKTFKFSEKVGALISIFVKLERTSGTLSMA